VAAVVFRSARVCHCLRRENLSVAAGRSTTERLLLHGMFAVVRQCLRWFYTAALPEIAGYTSCCWLTQIATLAGACLQFVHEDHTHAYRSVIFGILATYL